MKILVLCAILGAAAPAFAQDGPFTIGAIDFYGRDDLDVDAIRAQLPLRAGDQLPRITKAIVASRLRRAIRRTTGFPPADIAAVCCDNTGRVIIYVGLRGETVRKTGPVRKTLYNAPPRGSARLPPAALKVHRDAEEAWLNAMQKGVTGEDDSQGFALSLDPEARIKQLALHQYAVRHAPLVRRVLASARSVEHRQIAAQMLGYAGKSPEQIAALIRASHDVDDGVRNNAIRALVVLARSNPEVSAMIQGECFLGLLSSDIWTDRNKSAELLAVVTAQRHSQLLTCLREQALRDLVEMAHWSYPNHSYSARLMLGRIAGIDEKTLGALIAKEEVEPIFNSLKIQRNKDDEAKRCLPCASLR